MTSGIIVHMTPSATHDELLDHLKASHAARTRSVRALRAAQTEYLEADRARKQAARTVLDTDTGHTHEQLADAMGFRQRFGLYRLASETKPAGGYTFSGDVLAELREIAKRFDKAARARRELVRSLRRAPRDERLTFEEMGTAMGLSAEGARYLTRGQ